jgi:hypothetical protein
MRQTISGVVAVIAVVSASAAPALACGFGYAPCGVSQVYVSPAPVYGYSDCYAGCGGWTYERLPDPLHQYYFVNQGPTYTGPGNFAPWPSYHESAWGAYRHGSHYHARLRFHRDTYGYAPRHRHSAR